ncbi:hypothetical protein RRF57_009610 [Xylaria bambusicola]|uniref:Uncharacterized protein n=1 Tax=Xylaria bambusicola TaxID=326684 RepID=A0AAN7UX34_9PEZI
MWNAVGVDFVCSKKLVWGTTKLPYLELSSRNLCDGATQRTLQGRYHIRVTLKTELSFPESPAISRLQLVQNTLRDFLARTKMRCQLCFTSIVRGQDTLAENIRNGRVIADYASPLEIRNKLDKLAKTFLVWYAQLTSGACLGCWSNVNAQFSYDT